jgi:ABC-type multidrug transport system fused ATPase/permease subunit
LGLDTRRNQKHVQKAGNSWRRTAVRSLGFLAPQGIFVCAAAGAAILLTLAQLSLPWLMKALFDILTRHGELGTLRRICALIVGLAAITVLCDAVKIYFTAVVNQRVLVNVRDEIYAHLRRLPFAHFQAAQTGRTMSVLTSDAPMMITLYSPVLDEIFVAFFQLAVTMVILVKTYGWMTLLAPLAVGIYLLVPVSVASPTLRCGENIQSRNAELSADLQESLSGTREIKVFYRDGWDLQRMKARFAGFLPVYCRIARLDALASSNMLLYWVVVATLYALGGKKVLAGDMSLGSLVALIWYIGLLDDPLRRISVMQGKLQTALAAAAHIFDILDIPVSDQEVLGAPHLSQIKGHLQFENVSFSYVENTVVLSNMNFAVSPGQRLAIAGKSGAGKTTLVNLIPRLHDPTSGRILIDGIDTRSVSLESLRRQIGILFQDVFPI